MDKSVNMIEKYEKELYDIVKLYMDLQKIKLYLEGATIYKIKSDNNLIYLSFGNWLIKMEDNDYTFNININGSSEFFLALHNNMVCITDKIDIACISDDDDDYDSDEMIIYKPLDELIQGIDSTDGLTFPKLIYLLRKAWINLLL